MSNFQKKIIDTLEKDGWIVVNLMSASKNGFPDLIAQKNGYVCYIESKEPNDTLKPLQKFRINEFIKIGVDAICLKKGKGIIYGQCNINLHEIIQTNLTKKNLS